MKKFKSKVDKLEKKIKRLTTIRRNYGLVFVIGMIFFGPIGIIGGIGSLFNWPFALLYGGICSALAIVSIILGAFSDSFDFFGKKLDAKIQNIQQEIAAIAENNRFENVIYNEYKIYKENNCINDNHKLKIKNLINEKAVMDKKLKKSNPGLETELIGDAKDFDF